ncbi:cupin domain-containing protein [Parvularcula sp. ZS-1/3]|uniref:Cupin domain-containing protein n=1 Tax=Parvularcula mediterranea TaxID=2732508 RepID=A0A7Y3RMA2_9PROT|nr:cupin domain-containing protein [Parvularcula mediterranea]NNU16181.1 cupin domain-containing protein [Parvularcula mediterranea]
MSDAPTLTYWHVYTDSDGISRQGRRTLEGFEKQSMGGDAAEQWNNVLGSYDAKILFAELPVGFDGDWHENPEPQWIIPLSGTWWVETMDGDRVEMGPGEVSFGNDQDTNDEKGHKSGVVGDEPCRMMIVQLDKVPEALKR